MKRLYKYSTLVLLILTSLLACPEEDKTAPLTIAEEDKTALLAVENQTRTRFTFVLHSKTEEGHPIFVIFDLPKYKDSKTFFLIDPNQKSNYVKVKLGRWIINVREHGEDHAPILSADYIDIKETGKFVCQITYGRHKLYKE